MRRSKLPAEKRRLKNFIKSYTSLMTIEKSKGPKWEPCVTPDLTLICTDWQSKFYAMFVNCLQTSEANLSSSHIKKQLSNLTFASFVLFQSDLCSLKQVSALPVFRLSLLIKHNKRWFSNRSLEIYESCNSRPASACTQMVYIDLAANNAQEFTSAQWSFA